MPSAYHVATLVVAVMLEDIAVRRASQACDGGVEFDLGEGGTASGRFVYPGTILALSWDYLGALVHPKRKGLSPCR